MISQKYGARDFDKKDSITFFDGSDGTDVKHGVHASLERYVDAVTK